MKHDIKSLIYKFLKITNFDENVQHYFALTDSRPIKKDH